MQQITTTQDTNTPINIINIERVRDIPGGASVTLADLINGNEIEQATPLSAPSTGKRTVCKQGKILAGSTTTAIKLTTGKHNFKVGEAIGTQESGKAYNITDITSASGVDTLTVGTAIDTPTEGDFVYKMAGQTADSSVLANVPVCISGRAFTVDNTKVIEAIPAYESASVLSGVIGSVYLGYMKNIAEVSY